MNTSADPSAIDLKPYWTKVKADFFEASPRATSSEAADIALSGIKTDITVVGVAALIAAAGALLGSLESVY